jgi:hypothetical protein
VDRRVGELPGAVLAVRDHVAVAGDDDGNDVHLGLPGLHSDRPLVNAFHLPAILNRPAQFPQHGVGMVRGFVVGNDDDVDVGRSWPSSEVCGRIEVSRA